MCGGLFSNLSFAILLITYHLLIKFTLTFLLSLHHCPPAVCSSHFHLTSTFCLVAPSVFCCCDWEASWRRKRPPVVCSLSDNTSLNVRLCEAAWQEDLNYCLDADRDEPLVLITGLDYFKSAQAETTGAGYLLLFTVNFKVPRMINREMNLCHELNLSVVLLCFHQPSQTSNTLLFKPLVAIELLLNRDSGHPVLLLFTLHRS